MLKAFAARTAGIVFISAAAAGWYGAGLYMRRTQGATERGKTAAERGGREHEPLHAQIDKLRSYGVAQRQLLPGVEHRHSRYLNNRAENLHRPTRRRERQMHGLNRPDKLRTSSAPTLSFTVIPSPPTPTGRLYLSRDPIGRLQCLAPGNVHPTSSITGGAQRPFVPRCPR